MMACMDDKALTAIALDLYALPFDEFMAARTAAAKAATGSGKELPAAVKALPKPSVAAWAVNMMAVHESAVLAQLADLGQRMRAAQSSLDAGALRELARERRALLSDAVDTARSVAERHGRAISATDRHRRRADPGCADHGRRGRGRRPKRAAGPDTVRRRRGHGGPRRRRGGSRRSAGATRRPAAHHLPIRCSAPSREQKDRTTAAGTARQPADQPRLRAVRETPRPASPSALEKAKAVLADAKAAEEEAARLATERRDQLAETEEEVAELTRETRDLRERLKTAEERLDSARKWLSTAAAEAKQAARAAEKAQRSAVLAQERVLRLGNTRD